MKHLIYLSLVIISVCACSKDTIPPENEPEIKKSYIKALINNVPLCLYRDSVHTLENAEFSFGTGILSLIDTGEAIDSSLRISARTEEMYVSLQFSYRKAVNEKTISLYRNTPDITYHFASAGLESLNIINGIQQNLTYTTYCYYEKSILSEPVGEVTVTSFDAINKNISGTFWFTAYGAKHENTRVIDTNEKLFVEEGEFYVDWENELFE